MDLDAMNVRLNRLERDARQVIDSHPEMHKGLGLVKTAAIGIGGRLDALHTDVEGIQKQINDDLTEVLKDQAAEIMDLRKTLESQAAGLEELKKQIDAMKEPDDPDHKKKSKSA